MKRFITPAIFFSLLFTFSCSVKQGKVDCKNIHVGQFEYRGGFSDKAYRIERNDSIQIENDGSTGLMLKLKIEWISDCEYKLTLLSAAVNGKDTTFNKAVFPEIRTTIKEITKSYYIGESKVGDLVHTDTMIILKRIGGFKPITKTVQEN